MRRKPGSLLPLEIAICTAASDLRRRGVDEFHGYELAKHLSDISNSRLLTGYGTLYRALDRLERMGFLQSRPEDPMIAMREKRPPRRLYVFPAVGEEAIKQTASTAQEGNARRPRRRWVPA